MNVIGRVAVGFLTFWLLVPPAFGGEHHTLRFLDKNSRTPQRAISMAISPDGKEVSFCVEPGVVHFIRTADGEKIAKIQAQPFVMNYSRDGSRILMVGRSETLSVETRLRGRTPILLDDLPGQTGLRINRRNGKLLIEMVHEGGPAAATGKFVVGDEIIAAGEGKSGPMIDTIGFAAKDFTARFRGPVNAYLRIQVLHKANSRPETILLQRKSAVKKADGTVEFIPVVVPPIADNVCFFLRNGSWTFFSTFDGKPIGSLISEDLWPDGASALSPDQRRFAIFATTKGRARKYGLEIFDLTKLERSQFVPVERNGVSSLTFSADNKELFAANWEFIDVFDVSTGHFLRSYRLDGKVTKAFNVPQPPVDILKNPLANVNLPTEKAQRLAVSPTLIAAGSAPGDVELVDLATGASMKTFPLEPKDGNHLDRMVEALQFSPDGRWLVFYVKGVLHIVDVSDIKGESKEP